MPALFNRQFAITVRGLILSSKTLDPLTAHKNLRATFRVERTSKPEPNTAEVVIYNLSPDSRSLLSEESDVPATIEAGYFGTQASPNKTFEFFRGNVVSVATTRQAVDWVTKIQLSDGGKAFRKARINEPYRKNSPKTAMISKLVDAFGAEGVQPGNALQKLTAPMRPGVSATFNKGGVISGRVERRFDELVREFGFEWSIQDSQLQVVEPLLPIDTQSITLEPATGVIGSPERGEKGIVKLRCLIQPGLNPKKTFQLLSSTVSGLFKVERTIYTGDTQGQDWYAEIEAKPV